MSRRVHSSYERRLLDTAIGDCEVAICLAVRRFLCLSPECPKATFAEQVSTLTAGPGTAEFKRCTLPPPPGGRAWPGA